MNYFKDCKTQDDVKRLYRELAKKLHPDTGGSQKDMVELQRQYEEMLKYGPENVNSYYSGFRTGNDDAFQKAQEEFNRSYAGYGGYRYNTQSNIYNQFKQQANDPRLAEYERMKSTYNQLQKAYSTVLNENQRLYLDNEDLKKKLERLKKKFSKPSKTKKQPIESPSICL